MTEIWSFQHLDFESTTGLAYYSSFHCHPNRQKESSRAFPKIKNISLQRKKKKKMMAIVIFHVMYSKMQPLYYWNLTSKIYCCQYFSKGKPRTHLKNATQGTQLGSPGFIWPAVRRIQKSSQMGHFQITVYCPAPSHLND